MTLVQKEVQKVYMYKNGQDVLIRPTIHATGISLDQSSINLTTVGQTAQLTATLTPADSTDTVNWSSSNTSIATVNSNGLVTCVTPGSATITATANGHSATCNVINSEWILFTETDLSTGSLGLFTAETTSWKGQYARAFASITNDGQGNYYYQTEARRPVCLRLRSNYPTLWQIPSGKSNRKIKWVCDYLMTTGKSTQVLMGRHNRDSKYYNSMTTATRGNYSRWTGYSANVVYTAESILDVSTNKESGTIYLKSNGNVAYTFGPNTLSTATSGTYYENDCWLGYGTDTDYYNVRLGNVHLYYKDIN